MRRALLAAVFATVVPSVALGQATVNLPSVDGLSKTMDGLPLTEWLANKTAKTTKEITARVKAVNLPTPEHLKPVVMLNEPGGQITQHEYRFRSLASLGSPVEIRGACISACTLVMSYVPKERLCFGEGSYLSFHAAVSSMETWAYNGPATERMYRSYPPEIKAWLDGRGGWEKLKPLEYWPLFARDLWAMGYAQCK